MYSDNDDMDYDACHADLRVREADICEKCGENPVQHRGDYWCKFCINTDE